MSLLKRLLYAMIFSALVFRILVRVFKIVATTGSLIPDIV
jgi:hypothetical protein